MWIVLFEVSKKGAVREVEQARGVIGHDVVGSRDEESARAVAMEALMSTGFVAKEGGGARLGDSSFVLPAKSRGVVRSVFDGAVGEVIVRGHHTELALTCRLFEVAIGHRARRVVDRDERGTDIVRKGVAPHARLELLVHEDAAKAKPGPISGANEGGVFRHDLG